MLYGHCDEIRCEKCFDNIRGKLDCNSSSSRTTDYTNQFLQKCQNWTIKKCMMTTYLFFLATSCSVQPVIDAWCDM